MSIKLGNSNITLKVGDTSVSAAYLGSTLVYSGGTSPTFQGKYLATFSDGHTQSAVCDASSAISAFYGDLVSLQIGDCVTGTSEWLCHGLTGLTSVDLGNSLMSIANGSFMGTAITAITIPNSVTSIGAQAFQQCNGLTELTIPSGVTSIGDFAFMGCNSLSAITFESTYPPTLGRNAIDGYSEVTIYVPCDSLEYYKSAWTDLSNKIQCDSPTPPTPTGYTYSVTIQGLEDGDTTNITWNYGSHTDSNVGNGTYTYSTSNNTADVIIDAVTNYTVDHDHFTLYSGGSQTVTFTHQGGGGLVQIPFGEDMAQYYGQSIKRLVIGDTTTTANMQIVCEYFDLWTHKDSLTISQWSVSGQGQFSSINSLPIDITLTTPETLTKWTNYSQGLGETQNPFNDLQIEWA